MSQRPSRYEFWVRFVCSFFGFALLFGLVWFFYSDWTKEAGALCGVLVVVTSFLSARYGDRWTLGIIELFVGSEDRYR